MPEKKPKVLNYDSVPILTGVQPDHYNSHLNNFEDRYDGKLFEKLDYVCSSLLDDKLEQRFIFLCGTPGCGKTHFLVGLFRARAFKDGGLLGTEHSLYIQFPNLITEIIEGFSQSHSTRVGLLPYLTPKYLFVDDISKSEKMIDPNKMEYQIFKDILLDRFENKRLLVCTSNFTSIELKRMIKGTFGEYVLSRVESAGFFLDFPRIDFRREKSK